MTDWATKREAAEHVKVSTDLISDAVRDGDLKAYAVGKGSRDYRLLTAERDAALYARDTAAAQKHSGGTA
jgi:excisionase family DNA binding protein